MSEFALDKPSSDDRTGLGLRPPGSVSEDLFAELCDGCGQCVDVCQPGALRLSADGFPVLATAEPVCGACGLCADICTRGAISGDQPATSYPPIDVRRLAMAALIAVSVKRARY